MSKQQIIELGRRIASIRAFPNPCPFPISNDTENVLVAMHLFQDSAIGLGKYLLDKKIGHPDECVFEVPGQKKKCRSGGRPPIKMRPFAYAIERKHYNTALLLLYCGVNLNRDATTGGSVQGEPHSVVLTKKIFHHAPEWLVADIVRCLGGPPSVVQFPIVHAIRGAIQQATDINRLSRRCDSIRLLLDKENNMRIDVNDPTHFLRLSGYMAPGFAGVINPEFITLLLEHGIDYSGILNPPKPQRAIIVQSSAQREGQIAREFNLKCRSRIIRKTITKKFLRRKAAAFALATRKKMCEDLQNLVIEEMIDAELGVMTGPPRRRTAKGGFCHTTNNKNDTMHDRVAALERELRRDE